MDELKKDQGLVLVQETSHGDGIVAEHSSDNLDQLHRRLGNRQIQLIAIGGSIGTSLFVSIGGGLHKGGPGNLLLAWLFYSCIVGLINNCMAEMTVLMPVSGGFIRLAGHWVDDAFGFMAGWNFFLYQALCIPFEITAVRLVLNYWRDDIPVAAVCAGCIVAYSLLNVLAVGVYGETEFWLSGGKVILIAILYSFTFVAMCGGNPQHDAFGFRYWKTPGAFAEYIHHGGLGRFEGFLACVYLGVFTIVGPEYISMVSAEAKHPRVYIKNAFKTVYWRFAIFFIGGALCVGVLVAYNDPTLTAILSGELGGKGSAAASPYVIAMQNLGVRGLPHLVNALLITSIFSDGNTYVYCSTRTLYGLALEGRAPAFLRKCTGNGVPIYCFAVVLTFPFLSFLQVSSGSAKVLGWLTNIITGSGVVSYIVIATTYICFHRACKAQNIDRKTLPYYGWFQPYSAWIALVTECIVLLTYGYATFLPGWFTLTDFFCYYILIGFCPVLFLGWKLIKRTKLVNPADADLVWERPIIDTYEASLLDKPLGFWTEILQLLRFKRGGVQSEKEG